MNAALFINGEQERQHSAWFVGAGTCRQYISHIYKKGCL